MGVLYTIYLSQWTLLIQSLVSAYGLISLLIFIRVLFRSNLGSGRAVNLRLWELRQKTLCPLTFKVSPPSPSLRPLIRGGVSRRLIPKTFQTEAASSMVELPAPAEA